MWSSASGAVSSGGVQNTVSRITAPRSSGTRPGDQWLVAATRAKGRPASGFNREAMRPPAKSKSSGRRFSCAAAIRASLSRRRVAARCATPATAAAKRLA